MVDKHQNAVNEIEKKVDSESPQIRQWATQTLPLCGDTSTTRRN